MHIVVCSGDEILKDTNHQHKNNVTTWISDIQKAVWNEIRLKESPRPETPIGWSEWITTKVNMALNAAILQQADPHTNTVEAQHFQRQIAKLHDRIRELEAREIGVSDTRILRILSTDEYTLFDNIVQALIDNEAEAAYEAIQRLTADGEVECDREGRRWRLKRDR